MKRNRSIKVRDRWIFDEEVKNLERKKIFYYEDVRSAVQGLIQEIKEMPAERINLSKLDIISLIRKWFPF